MGKNGSKARITWNTIGQEKEEAKIEGAVPKNSSVYIVLLETQFVPILETQKC